MNKKVLVAMSGGVDSSVCAVQLKNQGYDTVGVTLNLAFGIDSISCSNSGIQDAEAVSEKLKIPHFTYDLKEDFKENVVEKFVSDYENGLTPNPCLYCNRYVKFKAVLNRLEEFGADYIATGHYAKIEYNEKSGRYLLKKASDTKKDQTYVLYNLTQEELSHILFPLGNMDKEEVRKIATENNFINANKPDSQDICFIPDGDYGEFIRKYRGYLINEGDYIDKDGNILGKHKGYINYTTGQRKGLGVAFGKPMYVIGKNKEKNQVILGDEKDLYTKEMYAKDVNLISISKIDGEMKISAKTRYSQKEVPAVVTSLENNRIKVVFETPVRAVTSGQAVVMYDGDVVVGGGIIE